MDQMVKEQRKSAFHHILNSVYESKNMDDAKKIVLDFLNDSDCPIRQNQRHLIKVNVERCSTLVKLQQYVTNSFLMYEGNGIVKPGYKGCYR